MKKILATALSLFCLISTTACAQKEGQQSLTSGDVKVCTTHSLDKVLQNKAYNSGTTKLEMKAFQNDNEAAQIIITPDYNVRSYSLKVNDLTCGENTIPKENFDLFHEMYIALERDVAGGNKHFYNGLSPYQNGDMVSDGLLPLTTAIEYGENVIKAGNNQGIYVSLKVPKGQPAGVYRGNFLLNVDGKTTTIPVEVTVWDYEISDETHARSTWAVMFDNNKYGEANLTKYMERVYVDNLLNFRLSPQNLPVLLGDATNLTKAKLDEWIEEVVRFAQDPRCSYINVPVKATSDVVVVNGKEYSRQPNMELYEYAMTITAERSLKEGINLFEKMDMWLNWLDESEQNGNVNNEELATLTIKNFQNDLAADWKAQVDRNEWFKGDYSYDKDFAYEIIETMRTLKQFLSDTSDGVMRDGTRFEAGTPDQDTELDYKDRDAYFNHPVSYITRAQEFDYSQSREFFEDYNAWYNEYYQTDDAEQWLYTGVYPHYPYVNVLMDCDLIMQRATGWMMQQYNVKGMQMWYSNMYQDMTGYNTGMKPISDPYANSSRFPETNGDGFTTYPGMPYGIVGPINTMRIYSLRDTMEDYEVLYLLENEYKKVVEKAGLEYDRNQFEKMVEYINERFFEHGRIKTGDTMNENFFAAREAVVDLLDMVTKTETIIADYEKLADKAVLTFLSTKDASLTMDGKALTKTQKEAYSTAKATISVAEVTSSALQVKAGSEEANVEIALGYKNEAISAQSVKGIFSASVADNSATMDGGVYLYTMQADASESGRYFDLDFSSYNISSINGELWMSIYNYGNSDVTFNLYASHTDNAKFKEFVNRYGIHGDKVTKITLKPGENLVKIPTIILVWNMAKQRVHGKYEALATLRFETTTAEEIKLGFGQFTIERVA